MDISTRVLRRHLDARRIGFVFTLGLGLGMAVCVAWAVPASADSVADLNRPSSTIPGCVNTWNPTDPKYGSRTCEGQAAAQSWQERTSAIITARNVIIDASDDPHRADKETVLGALNTLAATADTIADTGTGAVHPPASAQNAFATTLAWMRQQFEAFHLPVPASLGDGFRTMAGIFEDPRILIVDRNAVYDRSAAMADALSEAFTESIGPDVQATDAAVLAAHQAAVSAAQDADRSDYNAESAAAAIAKAAGPDHAAIADGQFRILQASIASHPAQSTSAQSSADVTLQQRDIVQLQRHGGAVIEQAEHQPVHEVSDRLRIVAGASQPGRQFGELGGGLGRQRRPCRAGPQPLGFGEHRLEHAQPGWIGQIVEMDLVPLRDGIGPVGADGDALDVGRYQQRRVLQRPRILQELPVRGVQVLMLALVLPGEPAAAPESAQPSPPLALVAPFSKA